jgi:hypothetical protein
MEPVGKPGVQAIKQTGDGYASFPGDDTRCLANLRRGIRVRSGTGRAQNGLTVASAEGHAPVVNWDIVSHDMEGVKQRLREVAADVERGWKRMTG